MPSKNKNERLRYNGGGRIRKNTPVILFMEVKRVRYTMTTPCDACPFLKSMSRGFSMRRLNEFASGEFPCHKTAKLDDNDLDGANYEATESSVHCAGALIFNEKRERPHQMMRICERIGMYDMTKLNMDAPVR